MLDIQRIVAYNCSAIHLQRTLINPLQLEVDKISDADKRTIMQDKLNNLAFSITCLHFEFYTLRDKLRKGRFGAAPGSLMALLKKMSDIIDLAAKKTEDFQIILRGVK